MRYLPGGVKSGMNYVEEEVIARRLFLIKGRRNVMASQVMLFAVLYSEPAFYIDQHVFVNFLITIKL